MVYLGSLGEQPYGVGRVVGKGFDHIPALVPHAVAGDHTNIAFAQATHGAARAEHAGDAGVAKHDLVFPALLTNIYGPPFNGVPHVAFPTAIDRLNQNLIVGQFG